MNAEVVILVPVLRRPHRVEPLLESIAAATPEPHRVLFIASPGDEGELAALSTIGADVLVLDQEPAPGDYARKINAGHRASTEPLLFLGADDLHFHPGWLERAADRLGDRVHVVGTNDLGNQSVIDGNHATHSLVTRAYVDQLGTLDEVGVVLHEGYPHEYVDVEFVETAKARGAWAFAGDSIVEHLHPHWGKAPTDELYDQFGHRMQLGRRVWRRRQQLLRRQARRWALRPPTVATIRAGVTVITASLPERSPLLAEAAASVAAQTVPVAHLIGVDAGRSVSEVRNALVETAQTEWVAFLDDDDLLDPHHVATLLEHTAGADVVIPHCRFDGPPLPPKFCNRPYSRADLRKHGIFPITVLARRQAVLDVGGFPLEGWDDWGLWNRMADARCKFTVVPEVTWTYRTDAAPDRRTHRLQAATA